VSTTIGRTGSASLERLSARSSWPTRDGHASVAAWARSPAPFLTRLCCRCLPDPGGRCAKGRCSAAASRAVRAAAPVRCEAAAVPRSDAIQVVSAAARRAADRACEWGIEVLGCRSIARVRPFCGWAARSASARMKGRDRACFVVGHIARTDVSWVLQAAGSRFARSKANDLSADTPRVPDVRGVQQDGIGVLAHESESQRRGRARILMPALGGGTLTPMHSISMDYAVAIGTVWSPWPQPRPTADATVPHSSLMAYRMGSKADFRNGLS
jgi:hypothetical protein